MLQESYIIKGDKEESKVIRWLLNQTGGKLRPAISGIHIGKKYTIATDGFRMVQAKTPDCLQELADLTLEHEVASWIADKIPAGDFIAEFKPVEGIYPNVQAVLPTSVDPESHITINLKFLDDLAKYGLKGEATIVSRGPEIAVEIRIADGERYALIMPIQDSTSNDDIRQWNRPKLAPNQ